MIWFGKYFFFVEKMVRLEKFLMRTSNLLAHYLFEHHVEYAPWTDGMFLLLFNFITDNETSLMLSKYLSTAGSFTLLKSESSPNP